MNKKSSPQVYLEKNFNFSCIGFDSCAGSLVLCSVMKQNLVPNYRNQNHPTKICQDYDRWRSIEDDHVIDRTMTSSNKSLLVAETERKFVVL